VLQSSPFGLEAEVASGHRGRVKALSHSRAFVFTRSASFAGKWESLRSGILAASGNVPQKYSMLRGAPGPGGHCSAGSRWVISPQLSKGFA
jgi:hypothetical protein